MLALVIREYRDPLVDHLVGIANWTQPRDTRFNSVVDAFDSRHAIENAARQDHKWNAHRCRVGPHHKTTLDPAQLLSARGHDAGAVALSLCSQTTEQLRSPDALRESRRVVTLRYEACPRGSAVVYNGSAPKSTEVGRRREPRNARAYDRHFRH